MGRATLYVGNLDSSVTKKELYKHFKAQAPDCDVDYCAVVTDEQHSLGYGFVEYSDYDQAAKAMKLLDSTMLISKPIQVFYSPFHNDSSPSVIFIKNLDKSFDKLALFDLVGRYGDILSINLASDDFQGYAVLRYDWVEAAQAAITGLNGSLFGNNKRLHVSSFLLAKHYGYPELAHNTLFLKLLSSGVSKVYLRDALCVFGVITGVRIVEKLPKGQLFGIVTFENSKVADKAAHALKNRFHPLFGYLGKLHQKTSTFRALGEMDAKAIIRKQLHLNLFEEEEGEKTKRSQAQVQVSQICPISLTPPCGPLPMYPPVWIYPLPGPSFGQQILYQQALPTPFPFQQPCYLYQQQLIPRMKPV